MLKITNPRMLSPGVIIQNDRLYTISYYQTGIVTPIGSGPVILNI